MVLIEKMSMRFFVSLGLCLECGVLYMWQNEILCIFTHLSGPVLPQLNRTISLLFPLWMFYSNIQDTWTFLELNALWL